MSLLDSLLKLADSFNIF